MNGHRGLSLIELLIVIAIIAMLLQLTLPAVEMSREKARGVSCDNNLKQLGVAAQLHVDTHGHFPSGGWGWRWAGDPDRGHGKEQPGGWNFNVLPYLEESDLRNLGKGYSMSGKREAGRSQSESKVQVFICPSRRIATTFPNNSEAHYFNIDRAERLAKSDYAANSGDLGCCDQLNGRAGPLTLEEGDNAQIEPPLEEAEDSSTTNGPFMWSRIARDGTGLVYLRSTVRLEQITDGLSHTYLFGEKYLEPSQYRTGKDAGDDQSWNVGFDKDTCRWTDWGMGLEPKQDTVGEINPHRFGSPHPLAMGFVLADGSVRSVAYTVDEEVHAQMGNRMDGNVVPRE